VVRCPLSRTHLCCAGTENPPGIAGLAAALTDAYQNLDANNAYVRRLRDRLIGGITAAIPECQLTGHPTERLPNNASFAFRFVEGESILLSLDVRGIYASSASACTSGALEPSHVIAAVGLPDDYVRGSLRLTTGLDNTPEQIERVLAELPAAIQTLREMSPAFAGGAPDAPALGTHPAGSVTPARAG
jgi:cysteine desulfurase